MTQDRLDDILGKATEAFRDSGSTEKAREAHFSYLSQELGSLLDVACATVRVFGESAFVRVQAETACLQVLDVLQLLVALSVPPEMGIRVDFRFFESAGFRPVLITSEDGKSVYPSRKRFGPRGSCIIDEAAIAKLEAAGLGDILSLVGGDDLTEIETIILRAVHWFADGDLQRNLENRLQSYVTCLDMFFSSRDGEATTAVQDGVAYVMGDMPEDRIELHSFVGKVYDYRSRASHEGESLDFPTEVARLRHLTISFIAQILRRRAEFPTKKQLKDWIKFERLH